MRPINRRRAPLVAVQTVEELADRLLGPEHVKGHVRPVLRDDLAFALRFGAAFRPMRTAKRHSSRNRIQAE